MSFQLLQDAATRFEVLEELGAGSYGRVFRARDKQTGLTVAVKAMSCDADNDGIVIDRETMEKEVALMRNLSKNEFIVTYHDAFNCVQLREFWISMELCEIGSCLDLIRILQDPFHEAAVQSVTRDCTLGLSFLHRQKVVHRDLKAGNVLLTNQGRARLTDFGVSAALGKEAKKRMTIIGSPYWMAPEVIQEVGYSFPADIWGLGITIIEMAEMMPPRAEMQPMKVLLKIPTLPSPTLEHPKSFSPEMSHFLDLALKKSPTLRSTAEQLAQHPWVANVAPTRVIELVKQGFEMIRKCGGRESAMRNRSAEGESSSATNAKSTVQLQKSAPGEAGGEVRSKEVKRKKAKRKPSAQSAASEAQPAAPTPVVVAEGKQLSADAASVMKKLTRVLRAVKSLQGRMEIGELSKSACMSELAELHNQMTSAQSESGATDPACVSALRKLSNQLGKVALLAKSVKSDPVAAPAPVVVVTPTAVTSTSPAGKGPPPAPPVVKKKMIRRSVGSGKEPARVDAELRKFEELLASVHLEQFLQELRDLGVERVSDLQYVSEEDLAPTSLKPIQKKKLLSLYSEHDAVPLNKSLEALVSPKESSSNPRLSRGSRKASRNPSDPISPRADESAAAIAAATAPTNGRRASRTADTPVAAVKGEEAALSTPMRRSIKSGVKLESNAHARRGSVDTPLLSPTRDRGVRASSGPTTPQPPPSSPPATPAAGPSDVDPKKAIKKVIPKRSASTSSIPARK